MSGQAPLPRLTPKTHWATQTGPDRETTEKSNLKVGWERVAMVRGSGEVNLFKIHCMGFSKNQRKYCFEKPQRHSEKKRDMVYRQNIFLKHPYSNLYKEVI